MKKLFAAILVAIAVLATIGETDAQRRSTVSGVVIDADTRQGIIGAVVGFTSASDSTVMSHIISGAGGAFSTGLASGEWDVEANLLGYEPVRRRVNVTGTRLTLDTLFLTQGIAIDAVVKMAITIRSTASGDTLMYNADSFRVASDANVAGLLEKMPGMKVEGGTVEAQGEAIRKVFIDGREFLGNDVSAAISSLPAETVKSIEVFDKLSDNAEFTGIDDGEGFRAINIVLRESMRQGIMGQVSALYGVEPPDIDTKTLGHYGLAGGNVNIFQGDAKITVGGTFNNLNERHFTSEDILGAGDNNGIGNVGSLQLNYIDAWGKKDQWKFDGSYQYDVISPENHNITERDYYETENAMYSSYYGDSWRRSRNMEHQFLSRIDFKPNEFHELRIRPSVEFQGNNRNGNEYGIYYPLNGSDPIRLNSWNENENKGWETGLGVNYRVRLGKPGRTLSLSFNGEYGSTERMSEDYSERQDGSSRRQYVPSLGYNYSLRGGLTYTEPVGPSSLVNLNYNISYSFSDQDRRSYLWDPTLNGGLGDYDMSAYDPLLSGISTSGYITHRVGPGYRLQKKNGIMLAVSASYQYSTLESDRVIPVTAQPQIKADFNNITYSVIFDANLGNKNNTMRLRLFSRTTNPRIDDLQDLVNVSNLQSIRKGNSALRPSYNNMFTARFRFLNVDKGHTLTFNFGGNYGVNAVVERIIRESPGYQVLDSKGNVVETLDAVGSFTEPINMDGAWSGNFRVDYGFPVSFLKSNLNLGANLSYQQMPSQTGRWRPEMDVPQFFDNFARKTSVDAIITLGSNISEKVDFYLSYVPQYNRVTNTYFERGDSEYMRHLVRGDFKFVLPLNFTLTGNLMYYNYKSISGEAFSQQYFIANAGIGKKVFRSKRGEISLFVNDIFNQNVGYGRNAYAQYIQSTTNSIIGRYVGIKFVWNIRQFGKNGSQNMDMYETGNRGDGSRGGQGGGRPPGGPGGFGGGRPGGGGGRPF